LGVDIFIVDMSALSIDMEADMEADMDTVDKY
jgi:hypothetical protein